MRYCLKYAKILKQSRLFLSLLLALFSVFSYANTDNFIAISDIHFNPYAVCHQTPCYFIQQLNTTPVDQWATLLNQQPRQALASYGSDSNVILLNSAMTAWAQQAAQDHPQFVLVLGDFLAHHYYAQYVQFSGDTNPQDYQAFVDKTLQYLSMQLQHTFAAVPVYVVVGNNDSDSGDYSVLSKGAFFAQMAADFAPLVDVANRASFVQQFATAGYYQVTVPGNAHHRIIVLNSVLFSPRVTGMPNAQLDQVASQELRWLKQQLQQAQAAHDQVWLVMHIPPGIDAHATIQGSSLSRLKVVSLWDTPKTEQLLQLLQQFSGTVTQVISGHLHMDTFALLGSPQRPVGILTVVPAVSPIFGNNPGYKVYQFNPHTFTLLDYQTYYLDLSQLHPLWQLEYDFNQVYPHENQALSQNIQALIQGERLLAPHFGRMFQRFFTLSHTDAMKSIAQHWGAYWCALSNTGVSMYQVCYTSP